MKEELRDEPQIPSLADRPDQIARSEASPSRCSSARSTGVLRRQPRLAGVAEIPQDMMKHPSTRSSGIFTEGP
jgi:hypothetical protein